MIAAIGAKFGVRLTSSVQENGFVDRPRQSASPWFDPAFRADAFGRGRIRPHKSSGPPLLEPSLKVKRNSAHGLAP